MKEFCANCEKETIHKKDKIHHILHVGNMVIEGDAYGYICQECHEDGIITDSRELDKRYAECYRSYNNGMMTGAQIKKIRQSQKMSVDKFVRMLNDNGISYSSDEYKEIEADALVQSGKLEVFLRNLGGLPEWKGYVQE